MAIISNDRSSSSLATISIDRAIDQELKYIEGRKSGEIVSLKTPWSKYNQASLGGLEWQSIHLIAGMSGGGKTAIISQLEEGLIRLNPNEKFDILNFNFEMLARKLVGRKISGLTNLSVRDLYSVDDILTDEQLEAIKAHMKEMRGKPIFYCGIPGTIDEMKKTIKNHLNNRRRPLVVILDHSILIKKAKNERSMLESLYSLGAMYSELKKKYKIIFVVLSQLNRDIEGNDRRSSPAMHFPIKKDIFGADAIFQHSDIVMVTHRPEMLNIEKYGPDSWPVEGTIYWHFLKTRDGEPHIAAMVNKLKYNRVEESTTDKSKI